MIERGLVIGASGGIGKALASALVVEGVDVTCLSRRADGLDITDPASVTALMRSLSAPFHTILVATGVLATKGAGPEKSLDQVEAQEMARVIAVNTIGPALILKEVPRLLPRKGRAVVGVLTARVGSIGDNRLGGWYSYRASKAGANQIVRCASIEIRRKFPDAIVVALHPGTVETEFTRNYTTHSKVTPEVAANNLLSVLDRLTPADSGGFFDWSGARVPW